MENKKKKLVIVEEYKIKENKQYLLNNYMNLLNINFQRCVKGYHLINASSINETMWEDLNTLIFTSSGIEVFSKSDGSFRQITTEREENGTIFLYRYKKSTFVRSWRCCCLLYLLPAMIFYST